MPPETIIVVGLGFGDEGKGTVVDYLVRKTGARLVVRYNGGAQAAHHVVTTDGREHTFAQFGAGTFVPGCRTHLSKHVVVNPLNLLREYDHLREIGEGDALDRLSIDRRSLIVTPFHVAANRARETARGASAHGSCGEGIGEARGDFLARRPHLVAGDFGSPTGLLRKLRQIQEMKFEHVRKLGVVPDPALAQTGMPEFIADQYRRIQALIVADEYAKRLIGRKPVVFEGAQGVLLDEKYGFAPHHTWTDTTTANAHDFLNDFYPYDGPVRTVGVTRAYATRHGAGPFPTYSRMMTETLTDTSNGTGRWQGDFRVGHLDLVMLNYAARVCPVDEVAVTCIDRARGYKRKEWMACRGYSIDGDVVTSLAPEDAPRLAPRLARAWPLLEPFGRTKEHYRQALRTHLNAPVTIWSSGPTASDKIG